MPGLSRRSFVAWLGTLSAALGFGRRVAAAGTDTTLPATRLGRSELERAEAYAPPLDEAMLVALATVILPSELGADGSARVARGFARWIAGYRAGAEVLHPYGSAEIEHLGPSPLPAWRQQLAAIDAAARTTHGASWTSLGMAEREALVRSQLAGKKLTGMPEPLSAPHVAVALLAYFYTSPEAADLCYRVQIRKNQCRPLANAAREPLPLAPGGGR